MYRIISVRTWLLHHVYLLSPIQRSQNIQAYSHFMADCNIHCRRRNYIDAGTTLCMSEHPFFCYFGRL